MKKRGASATVNLSKEGRLNFLFGLYEKGVPISEEDKALLLKHGYIKPAKATKPKADPLLHPEAIDGSHTQNKADQYVDLIEGDLPGEEDGKRHVFLDTDTYDKIAETSLFTYQGGKNISKEDWIPADKIYHTDEFVKWINSINSGFQKMTRYVKFAMYCQQAADWLAEDSSVNDYATRESRDAYRREEYRRCKENTLYFLDKYIVYSDVESTRGTKQYVSAPVHKVLCYMIDCGYSIMAGKPRQIAATTTIGAIAVAKLVCNKNYFIKMIAQDKDKVEEIFDDKIKFPFSELPDFLRPSVINDRDNFLRLGVKNEKGKRGGLNSKLRVVAPTVSAINGGAPPLVLIDEAGYIRILGKMMKEARPTMFRKDDRTGKLVQSRQIVVWGTGGETDGGGKAYENEFMNTLDKWNRGEHETGIIPLFFDWTTRPGITKEYYLKEKKAYTVEGPDKEERMVQFRQSYPSIVDDMFLTSQKLLVSPDWINRQIERIRDTEHKFRPIKGYFEPIYDESQPQPEGSDTPYKIIGSKFIPLDDLVDDMNMATVEILSHPERSWENRYVQGTDPIGADNGYSNMASAIFDRYWRTPVAILNYRESDHKKVFLQTLLLGLYYGDKEPVKELVEGNIGTAYMDYKENKGFRKSLVYNSEVPNVFQGGGTTFGIDNRGMRNRTIVSRLRECIAGLGEKIYFMTVFSQTRVFVCTYTDKGNETWGVKDKRSNQDDVLFGLVFAYICDETFAHRPPVDKEVKRAQARTKFKLVRQGDGSLRRVQVTERVN